MSRRCGRSAHGAVVALAMALAAGRAGADVPVPGAPQAGPVAIVDATVHPVGGPVIEHGTVLFDGGRIVAVGADVTVPAGARRVDGAGRHVYPGLLHAWSRLGLSEIQSVRGSEDLSEVDPITPNVRAQVAFQSESEVMAVNRASGVLLAHIVPRGGVLSGQSALMELDGWTWEDMTRAAPLGLRVAWPPMVIVRGGDVPEERQRQARQHALDALEQAFRDARAYDRAARAAAAGRAPVPPVDQRWEALRPVLAGRLPLLVEAQEVHQIEAAVAFAAAESLQLVIVGGYDAPDVAGLLAEHDVPVIVTGTYVLPRRRGDDYDACYTLPERLREAGVRFCIATDGASWAERNLADHAAAAVAYGLPADEALRAVTLYPARILGVADRVGSLAPGLDATLILTDGELFDPATRVEAAWIEGRAVDLSNHQAALAAKYRERLRRRGGVDGAAGSVEH